MLHCHTVATDGQCVTWSLHNQCIMMQLLVHSFSEKGKKNMKAGFTKFLTYAPHKTRPLEFSNYPKEAAVAGKSFTSSSYQMSAYTDSSTTPAFTIFFSFPSKKNRTALSWLMTSWNCEMHVPHRPHATTVLQWSLPSHLQSRILQSAKCTTNHIFFFFRWQQWCLGASPINQHRSVALSCGSKEKSFSLDYRKL